MTLSFSAPDKLARHTLTPRPESFVVEGNQLTLQRGERVLSRREAQSYGAGGGVNVTIMAGDAESFRQSRTQVAADIARAVSLGRRGM